MTASAEDMRDVSRWVPGTILRSQALARPDKEFLICVDGDRATFAEADRQASRIANALTALGIGKGDRVAVMLPNGLEHCYAWLGISRAGAVLVAVNVEYRGTFLTHVLGSSRASVLICHTDWLERIEEIEAGLPMLETVVWVGEAPRTRFERCDAIPFSRLLEGSAEDPTVPVSYRDVGCIMYTSGTTGPSKGVLMPNAHNYLFGLGTVTNYPVTAEDVYYVVLPLFHANGLFMQVYASLIAGCTAVLRTRFSASQWLKDVRRYRATVSNSLGVIAAFILGQPPDGRDRQHELRTLSLAPNPPGIAEELQARFGIENLVALYGMTEVNIPLFSGPGLPSPGSCGRCWDEYFEVAIADPDSDELLAADKVGELLVRPRQPYGFMAGYDRLPEKTVEAWRNFWFHTGDAARRDRDGNFYFVDRIKDCIRRRGENISSFEIETVIGAYEGVVEVATVAVESEIRGGEDEIKAVVVCDRNVSPASIVEWCELRLPSFAVPRYIELVAELPKTPTGKVQKHKIREQGITSQSWDRTSQPRTPAP